MTLSDVQSISKLSRQNNEDQPLVSALIAKGSSIQIGVVHV